MQILEPIASSFSSYNFNYSLEDFLFSIHGFFKKVFLQFRQYYTLAEWDDLLTILYLVEISILNIGWIKYNSHNYFRVATISKFYLTITGITISCLRAIIQCPIKQAIVFGRMNGLTDPYYRIASL